MTSEIIQITTTTAEKSDAEQLSRLLLEQRFAACAQVMGPVDSTYWWNHRLETAREWKLIIKTLASLYQDAEKLILEHHPYDEPEIMATPVTQVSEGYRNWLLEQLSPRETVVPPTLNTPVGDAILVTSTLEKQASVEVANAPPPAVDSTTLVSKQTSPTPEIGSPRRSPEGKSE